MKIDIQCLKYLQTTFPTHLQCDILTLLFAKNGAMNTTHRLILNLLT